MTPSTLYKELMLEAKNKVWSVIKEYDTLKHPRVMIVCGSGLGGIAEEIHTKPRVEIKYGDIPGFQQSTVEGHAGKLLFGLMGANQVPVMCMVGRLHFYEGYSLQEITFPIRLAKGLGISTMVVTNSAGGINSEFEAGELMLIDDHVDFPGLAGNHPLRGPNLNSEGPRFQPLSDAYDFGLRQLFLSKAKELGVTRRIHEGTYFFVSGPTYETRAEVRMIRAMGGDAVGMSTVPEVIVARHSGLRVLALSLITNKGLGDKPPSAYLPATKKLNEGMTNHEEVLQSAKEASEDVQSIIAATINAL